MTGGSDQTELWITAGFLLAGLAGAGAMAWLEHQPRDIMKPRLIPTTPVMFASALVALLALVHLVNLFGIRTGR